MTHLIKMDGRGNFLSARIYKPGYVKRKGKEYSSTISWSSETHMEFQFTKTNSNLQI